jgi:hypothetical protein
MRGNWVRLAILYYIVDTDQRYRIFIVQERKCRWNFMETILNDIYFGVRMSQKLRLCRWPQKLLLLCSGSGNCCHSGHQSRINADPVACLPLHVRAEPKHLATRTSHGEQRQASCVGDGRQTQTSYSRNFKLHQCTASWRCLGIPVHADLRIVRKKRR